MDTLLALGTLLNGYIFNLMTVLLPYRFLWQTRKHSVFTSLIFCLLAGKKATSPYVIFLTQFSSCCTYGLFNPYSSTQCQICLENSVNNTEVKSTTSVEAGVPFLPPLASCIHSFQWFYRNNFDSSA